MRLMSYRWVGFAALLLACGGKESVKMAEVEDTSGATSSTGGAGGSSTSESATDTTGEATVSTAASSGGSGGTADSGGSAGSTEDTTSTVASAASVTVTVTATATVSDTTAAASTGPTSSASTTGEQCECSEGDLCCDGCHVAADGCTDVAEALCDLLPATPGAVTCPQEIWEEPQTWACPGNEGAPGVACVDLGPLLEAVGDPDDPEGLVLEYGVTAWCLGDQLSITVSFQNAEFGHSVTCG